MGRRRKIDPRAKGTTVSLTPVQKSALRKLQTKRLDEGQPEPLLNEVVLEGFRLLLEKEGWSVPELDRVFPKQEVRVAQVRVFSKRRRPT